MIPKRQNAKSPLQWRDSWIEERLMHKSARNMTQGSIPRHLMRYSVPAILGDLFQVT